MSDPIGIVADTHDHIQLVAKQVETLKEHGVEELVHLGDVKEVDTMEHFSEQFEVHWVTGNGDECRKHELSDVVQENGGHAHGYNHRIDFGEKRFLLRHGIEHNLSYPIAATDDALDYVLHGHYHYQERTDVGTAEVLNPGAEGLYLYFPDKDKFEHYTFNVSNA